MTGLDIAGTSLYCDETGGDYYDYFELSVGRLGVVVADASGHGVGAALLMTTARALLRQRAAMAGDLANIVSDVNQELLRDVQESASENEEAARKRFAQTKISSGQSVTVVLSKSELVSMDCRTLAVLDTDGEAWPVDEFRAGDV